MDEEYDEKVCGQCKSAIRRNRKSDKKNYWHCQGIGPCEKVFKDCKKYKDLAVAQKV